MEVVNCIKVAIDSSSFLTTYSLLHIDWDWDDTCNSLQMPLPIQSYFPSLFFLLVLVLVDWPLTGPVSTTDGAPSSPCPSQSLLHPMPPLIPCSEDCYPCSQTAFILTTTTFTITLFSSLFSSAAWIDPLSAGLPYPWPWPLKHYVKWNRTVRLFYWWTK